jgi:signal transduction histidine kinase
MRIPSKPGRPGSRAAVVAGLLALAVALTAVLGYQALAAHRSHREVAEKTLREQAQVAAWEFAGAGQRALHGSYFLPGLDVVAKVSGKEPSSPFAPARELAAVSHERGWCWPGCVSLLFRLDARSGTADAVVPDAAGAAVAVAADHAELAEALEAVRSEAAGAMDTRWDMAIRLLPGGRVAAWRRYAEPGKPGVYYGFVASDAQVRHLLAKVFADVPLLPPSLTGGSENAALLAVRVSAPGAAEPLLDSDPALASAFTATHPFERAFGGMEARVALRPDAAPALVIGGLPASRLPLILGLMLLTLGLLGMSILQIRRESELARLRADFVSSVSHELRTPMAQIRMFAETLQLGRVRDPVERDRSMSILVNEARRLTHLVDNVLLFSRAERNGMTFQRAPTDLSALVLDVCEGFEPLAHAARQRLATEVSPGVNGCADAGALRQALLNLLDNAVKYGAPGQTIGIGLGRLPGDRALLWVEDEGGGVQPDRRERVWEPYFRLERHRESATAGSGIGLAVVQRVAEGHSGGARVEEARSGGARFVVEIGLAPDPGEA